MIVHDLGTTVCTFVIFIALMVYAEWRVRVTNQILADIEAELEQADE
jgi:cell division protein FtsW (lipid II flippase)